MYMRHFSESIRDIDVFVTPTRRGGLVGATNLTGHPAVVVPNGFRSDGTPTSITFTGRLGGDIQSPIVSIEPGGIFNGNCVMKPDTVSAGKPTIFPKRKPEAAESKEKG